MRNPAAQGRDDANQSLIAETYRQLGCSVVDTSELGAGYPDLTVGLVGLTELVEVKTATGTLTPAQERFVRDWRGSSVRIIRSPEEAIEHVQQCRKRIQRGE